MISCVASQVAVLAKVEQVLDYQSAILERYGAMALLDRGRLFKRESIVDVRGHWLVAAANAKSLTRLSFDGQGGAYGAYLVLVPGREVLVPKPTTFYHLSFPYPSSPISSFLSCDILASTDGALRTTSGRCQRRRGPLHSQGTSNGVSTSTLARNAQPRGSGETGQSLLTHLRRPILLPQGRALTT